MYNFVYQELTSDLVKNENNELRNQRRVLMLG